MKRNELGPKIAAEAERLMSEFLASAPHPTNPRAWTNQEVLTLVVQAMHSGAALATISGAEQE